MGVSEIRSDDERVVHNRNGHLLINSQGHVVSRYIDDTIDDFTGSFRYISRVDLEEWRKRWEEEPPIELDIQDIAYWFRSPGEEKEAFHPADEKWRDEVEEKTHEHRRHKPLDES